MACTSLLPQALPMPPSPITWHLPHLPDYRSPMDIASHRTLSAPRTMCSFQRPSGSRSGPPSYDSPWRIAQLPLLSMPFRSPRRSARRCVAIVANTATALGASAAAQPLLPIVAVARS